MHAHIDLLIRYSARRTVTSYSRSRGGIYDTQAAVYTIIDAKLEIDPSLNFNLMLLQAALGNNYVAGLNFITTEILKLIEE